MSNKDTITLPREVVEKAIKAFENGCSPTCENGMIDSGGFHSWGQPALVPCPACLAFEHLRTALAAEQPKPEALEVAYEFETHVLFGSGSTISRTLLEKAVTTLRSQHAENEALRRDAERLREELEEDAGVIAVWRGRTERAEAENERLREVEQRANELLKTLDAKFPMPVRHQDVNTQMFNLRAVLKLMEDKR